MASGRLSVVVSAASESSISRAPLADAPSAPFCAFSLESGEDVVADSEFAASDSVVVSAVVESSSDDVVEDSVVDVVVDSVVVASVVVDSVVVESVVVDSVVVASVVVDSVVVDSVVVESVVDDSVVVVDDVVDSTAVTERDEAAPTYADIWLSPVKSGSISDFTVTSEPSLSAVVTSGFSVVPLADVVDSATTVVLSFSPVTFVLTDVLLPFVELPATVDVPGDTVVVVTVVGEASVVAVVDKAREVVVAA